MCACACERKKEERERKRKRERERERDREREREGKREKGKEEEQEEQEEEEEEEARTAEGSLRVGGEERSGALAEQVRRDGPVARCGGDGERRLLGAAREAVGAAGELLFVEHVEVVGLLLLRAAKAERPADAA